MKHADYYKEIATKPVIINWKHNGVDEQIYCQKLYRGDKTIITILYDPYDSRQQRLTRTEFDKLIDYALTHGSVTLED